MGSDRGEPLLERYVAAVNRGVRDGAWEDMLALLREDAELEFVGIPVGPFHGREGIGAAYRSQPPDDELILLNGPRARGGAVTAIYAWAKEPARPAGELHLWEVEGRIALVRVLYERFSHVPSS